MYDQLQTDRYIIYGQKVFGSSSEIFSNHRKSFGNHRNFWENDQKRSFNLRTIFGTIFKNVRKSSENARNIFGKSPNLLNLVVCLIKRKLRGGLKYEFYFLLLKQNILLIRC